MIDTATHNTADAKEFFARKMAFTTGPVEVSKQIESGEDAVIVDVRDAEDFERGHIPGAVSLPQDRWDTEEGLSKESMNILYCYSPTCHLAAKAAVHFADRGYHVMEMDGGFEAWEGNDLEVEK